MSELFTRQELIDEYSKLLDAALKLSVADAVQSDIEKARAHLQELQRIQEQVDMLKHKVDTTKSTLENAQSDYNDLDQQIRAVNIAPMQETVKQSGMIYERLNTLDERIARKAEQSHFEDLAKTFDFAGTKRKLEDILKALGEDFDNQCQSNLAMVEKLDSEQLMMLVVQHIGLLYRLPPEVLTTKSGDGVGRAKIWKTVMDKVEERLKAEDSDLTPAFSANYNKAKALLKSKIDSLR